MASADQGLTDRQSETTIADAAIANMDAGKDSATVVVAPASASQAKAPKSTKANKKDKKKAAKSKSKKQLKKAKKHKRATNLDTDDSSEEITDDSESEAEDSSSDSEGSSSESSDSDSEREHIKSKKKSSAKGKNGRSSKKQKHKSLRKRTPSSSSSSSDTESSEVVDDSEDDAPGKGGGITRVAMTPNQLALFRQMQAGPPPYPKINGLRNAAPAPGSAMTGSKSAKRGKFPPPSPKKRSSKLDFKRVDQVWDTTIHNYRLQETSTATSNSQYDGYVLQVRRTFDWEGKYQTTFLDVKSKVLRECLQEVIGNIKGISLVDETPKLNPNMVFLYLEDLRQYRKTLSKISAKDLDKKERKKFKKDVENKRQHLKVLLKYLYKDYAEVKKSLYPMLENGLITFDLLWALFKPNTLIYTTTYGSSDEPRVFKVEQAEKMNSMTKGEFYLLDGKYMEYDGKQFGYGTLCEEIPEFRGARKISSLNAFPLDFHKEKQAIKTTLIERGKKFVNLGGVKYRSHQGLAYYKKKKSIIKVNINGRIMVDPSVHRRINPNYQVSVVRPKDHDILSDSEDSDEDEKPCEKDDSSSENACSSDDDAGCGKMVTKVVRDGKGKVHMLRIPKSFVEDAATLEKPLERVDEATTGEDSNEPRDTSSDKTKNAPEFSDEDYLIASSVVLGFSFSEKLWLEFTVSGVNDIQWNDGAYESLVLEPKQKDIVKALVESHKYHATESIDDVIQGKGKGLVAVLHGPPGTGKTLTAEGISELLKCPLYMVSAGELGTDSRYLETELQKILDICHAWGAILLLDEADVFLEERNLHEISRNALVSIFLRQLEYFQGILFLTTNRVETFDDAFQSRIHIALRYDSLTHKAKKAIFKIFVERVRVLEKVDLKPFTEDDYESLAKHDLNGRQIKNTIRTAQALAVNKGEPLGMEHISQVLDVQNSFDLHLKGGESYKDAMRSYY